MRRNSGYDELWEIRNGHRKARESTLLTSRVLLREGMEHGIEPPEELEPDVLLRGRTHWIYAPAESGKSWLALWCVKRCLQRGERVVYLDAENGHRIISERLEALGVPPETVDELLYYYAFPELSLDQGALEDYRTMLDEIQPTLVVFDSLLKFLGSAGLEENSNDDLAKWSTAFLRPSREKGIATMVLDHVPHDGDHARGASRKRDEADVMWSMRVSIPFDRDSVGRVVIRRDKDREAWLPERVGFSVGGTKDGFVFSMSDGTIEEPNPESGLTGTERRTLDTLRDEFGTGGATATEWKKAAKNQGVSEPSFWRAKRAITPPKKEGLVIVGNDSRFFAVFRPEPESDDSRESGVDKPKPENYHELSKNYHDRGDSPELSSLSPPFKGDSDDSGISPDRADRETTTPKHEMKCPCDECVPM